MIIKFVVFGGLITTLNLSEVLFERIFIARPWKFLFVSSDDMITEWRHRWSIDRYSFLFGMSFALGICLLKRVNIVEEFENNSSNSIINLVNSNGMSNGSNGDHHGADDSLDIRDTMKRGGRGQLSLKIKSILTLLSVCGMGFYYLFVVLCTSKESCDSYTTFITVIPV